MKSVELDKFTIRHANKPHCDRCKCNIEGEERILSYFNDETICMVCSGAEEFIKVSLSLQGKTPLNYMGCGYIPEIFCKMEAA